MILSRRALRITLAVIAFVILMLFSNVSAIVLVALIGGALAIILGIDFAYRPVSVLGLLMITSGAAASVEITSLMEVRMIMTAVVALLVPVFILAWVTLSSNEEREDVGVGRRVDLLTVGYVLACLFSVPLVATVVGAIDPQVSAKLSTMTGTAVLLLVAVGLGVVLTFREPRVRLTESEEGGSDVW